MSVASISPHPMRRSTRVRWRMAVHLTSLDPKTAFSETCETLVVNVHGAGVRSPAALAIATPVQLETGDHRTTRGWITDFEPLGQDATSWLLGIALEQPSNFWGISDPPDNWIGHLAPVVPPPLPDPERKFSVWPGAYGPQRRPSGETSVLEFASPATDPANRPAPAPAVVPPRLPASDPAQLISRLQADLERRMEEHWRRLRSELEPQFLASTRDLQQELQDGLAAFRSERTLVEGKLQELLAVRDEVSARLGSITSMLREQSAPLREEIIVEARTQVDQLIQEFQEQLRGERQNIESARDSVRGALDEPLQAKTDALLQQLRERSAAEIASLTSTAMDRLERQLQAKLAQGGEALQQKLLTEIEQRQQAASQAAAGHMEALNASETGLRDRIRQLADQLSGQSERVLAQLRVQLQEWGEKHEVQLADSVREHQVAAETTLRTAGAEMLSTARQALQADVHHQQQELAVSHQSLRAEMSTLQLRARELQARLDEVRQARDYVESLSRLLPEKVEQHVRDAVSAALERMSGPAQEQFAKRVQDGLAALQQQAGRVVELQNMLSQREQEFQELLLHSQQQADGLLRQQVADAAAAFQEQLRTQFEDGRHQFAQAQASAVQQLQTLQDRADQLTSLVDLELQKHADALIEETVAAAAQRLQAASEAAREAHREDAQADAATLQGKLQQEADALIAKAVAAGREQLQAATTAIHRDQLARAEAEIDGLLGAVVRQATDAGSELRTAIDAMQQELAQTKLDHAGVRREVEQAQALLARQTAQFQATLHDAFLQAGAEIKGRIHQAIEMAEEPLDRRSRDLQSQLTAAVQRMTQELRKQFDEARDRLQTAATASESHAEQALQERVAHAMQAFRQDADNLARRSMERWQAAVNDTLAEIPRLLGKKLGVDQQ